MKWEAFALALSSMPTFSSEVKVAISKERLEEIAAIPDKNIDSTDIPEAGEEFFKKAKYSHKKVETKP